MADQPTAPAGPPLQLLTVEDVAAILQVSRSQVYEMKHRIGFVVIGRRCVRFTREQVTAYVERQTRAPPERRPASSAGRTPATSTPATRAATGLSARTLEIL